MVGMASLVVAVVLGYLIGTWTAPDDAPVEPADAGEQTASPRRGDPIGSSGMDRAQLEAHLAFLEGEVAMQRLRAQTLEHELFGEPVPWPDEVPREHEPSEFRANVRQAVEECAPDVEIVGFDCGEPPCLVHLRGGDEGWWDRLINRCPRWVDPYGDAVSRASGTADCGGGSEERYEIVGPTLEQPDAGQDGARRWEQRVERARFEWECAAGAGP